MEALVLVMMETHYMEAKYMEAQCMEGQDIMEAMALVMMVKVPLIITLTQEVVTDIMDIMQ